MDDLRELVHDFLVESYENLIQLDADLLQLERDPSSVGTLASIFRIIHTVRARAASWASARWRR